MRIILLEKVGNLGNIGEEVNVKPGYARNFLIPRSKAVLATKKNIESFQKHRITLEDNIMKVRAEAEFRISEIKKIGTVVIDSKSGIAGKLFGSIGTREIASAIVKMGINISRYHVRLSHGNIRSLGDYDVIIQIYRGISTIIRVRIVDTKLNNV